jgi:hypothetical protein
MPWPHKQKSHLPTVTPLAVVYICCAAAVVHSAPPVLYLQLLGDEVHRLGRTQRARFLHGERHSRQSGTGPCSNVKVDILVVASQVCVSLGLFICFTLLCSSLCLFLLLSNSFFRIRRSIFSTIPKSYIVVFSRLFSSCCIPSPWLRRHYSHDCLGYRLFSSSHQPSQQHKLRTSSSDKHQHAEENLIYNSVGLDSHQISAAPKILHVCPSIAELSNQSSAALQTRTAPSSRPSPATLASLTLLSTPRIRCTSQAQRE